MLTAEGCKGRRERLWRALPEPCDFLIVSDPSHLIYVAGYVPSPFEFRTVEAGAILILEPDRATLVGDDMLGPFLERAFVDEVFAPTWYDGQHSAPYRRGGLVAAAMARLERIAGKRVGLEKACVPAGLIESLGAIKRGLGTVDLGPIIRKLRRSKDADEIAATRAAIAAGEAGQAKALAHLEAGMTELDAYYMVLQSVGDQLGAQPVLYGDFASGPRLATDKGGSPTSRTIRRGDLFLLDFSVVVSGYRGDFTNTFAVGKAPTDRQRELFEACVGAISAAEPLLKPGTPGHEIDAAVKRHFASLGLEKHFPTHSGHGIGLGHPEAPYFVAESSDVIQPGDIVAVEPGLYIEEVAGMRYEHNYLITPDGFERLTNHKLSIDQQ
jgi:Xaa-Pro aminopeptidase